MTYQVFYGVAPLNRVHDLLQQDSSTAVAIQDGAGNELSGIRLQLRLGYSCDD